MKSYLLLISILLLTGCTIGLTTVCFEETCIDLEVADDDEERAIGLMNRESLDTGMLFIFDEPITPIFWMENTLIPLEILWVDENFTILGIDQMVPCEGECTLYPAPGTILYTIEVNPGFSEEYNIEVGDTISIE